MVSSSFCRMLSSIKMCCTFGSKGSTHNGFPPRMEKALVAHLKTTKNKGLENGEKSRAAGLERAGPPFKVVLESSQTLDGAQVLVQASLSITARHSLLFSCQHHPPPVAADLPDGHVHLQLKAALASNKLPSNNPQIYSRQTQTDVTKHACR